VGADHDADAAAARTAEFLRLFRALPGPRHVDRIRQVCACCCVREGTVRQWLCTPPYRTPSERVLVMLRR
jgi:hypothetical protein